MFNKVNQVKVKKSQTANKTQTTQQQSNKQQEINMKVKLKSVLKTTDRLFQAFEQNQFIFHAGNALTIKQFHKPTCDFIHLTKQLTHLYSFKPTPSKKACFVAEKLPHDKIYISQYSLKKDRKAVCLSESPQFFPSNIVGSVELLVDEFDSHLVYGYARAGNDTCIFLVDFNKMKVVSLGFVPAFNDIKVNTKQNLTLTMCNGNSVRTAHVYNGFWQTDQKIYKKLGNINILRHQTLSGQVVMLCTRNQMMFMGDQQQLIQTINVFENNQDQIHQVLKLTKGILILSKKQKLKLYIEDHDQLTYLYKGQVIVPLNDDQKISKLVVNSSNDQVLLRTNMNQVYLWKVQDLQAQNQFVHEFHKVENGTIGDAQGTVSLASGKQTALLSSNFSIHLWDLQRNAGFLQTTFQKMDSQSQKALYASSINPDGNSLICAFQDKVKIYKILLTKLRFIAQFNIKKCYQLLYSHGGQYVACKYGKGANSSVTILNTLRMTQIITVKTHAQATFMLWNQMDDQLLIATDNNTITGYKISQSAKSFTVKIPQKINMVRIDYATKTLLVSTDSHIYVVDKQKIQKTLSPRIPKFNFIYPLHGYYFIASKDGNLYWSTQLTFDTFSEMPIFMNQPFNLLYRNGYMLAYSSFENITIVECLRQNLPAKKQLLKTSEDIVFVQRDEINRFFQKIKNLQSSVQALQNDTSIRLDKQRRKFSQSLQQNINKFQQQISYLQKKYQQTHQQKVKQQKQNSRVFQDLQSGQIKSVNELQKMYDRKLRLQKQKFLQIQQKNVQQKVHYQKVIYTLEKRYHDDIAKVRQQYATKMAQQFKRLQQIKRSDIQYKKKMQYKMISLQQQSDMALFQVQNLKDQTIKSLQLKMLKLQDQQNSNKVEFHNQLSKYKKMAQKFTDVEEDLKKHKQRLAEAYQRIKLLQQQVETKNKMIEERNNVIFQQEHQIGGLEKAKYVLSFRTTEIRKELQPKQSLIDRLKQEIFKLDQEFNQEKKKTYELNQRVQKIDKLNKILKQQNVQLGIKLKNKQRLHDQMSGQIFTIVNQMDQKQWPSALVKLYQTYIKEDHFKNMKKKSKDATSQEINRHLVHVEQSLIQATAGNQKILKAKQLDNKRKMKQNADLIYDFNQLKKVYNQRLKQIDDYKIQVSKLQQDLTEVQRPSRAITAKSTGRRVVSRQRPNQKGDLSNLDMSFKRESQIYFQKREIPTRQSRSRASSSGYRTMILRSDRKENSRFFDLAKELDSAKYKIQKQEKMIEELNERLLENTVEE